MRLDEYNKKNFFLRSQFSSQDEKFVKARICAKTQEIIVRNEPILL